MTLSKIMCGLETPIAKGVDFNILYRPYDMSDMAYKMMKTKTAPGKVSDLGECRSRRENT
jgi:hypothetical protein